MQPFCNFSFWQRMNCDILHYIIVVKFIIQFAGNICNKKRRGLHCWRLRFNWDVTFLGSACQYSKVKIRRTQPSRFPWCCTTVLLAQQDLHQEPLDHRVNTLQLICHASIIFTEKPQDNYFVKSRFLVNEQLKNNNNYYKFYFKS